MTAVLCSRAKQARCAEQYRSKNQYQRGMWNVNTVLMGGLGEDPDSSGSASEEGAAIFSMYTHNMYMHIYSCLYIKTHSCTRIRMYIVHVHACTCTCVFIYCTFIVLMYIHVCTCMYMYMYIPCTYMYLVHAH